MIDRTQLTAAEQRALAKLDAIRARRRKAEADAIRQAMANWAHPPTQRRGVRQDALRKGTK